MANTPIILVAGGETLYIDLVERLPRNACRVSYCETAAQTLDRADNAALLIVDSALAGGAEDLCRRMRASAATAHVPIILRAPPRTRWRAVDLVLPNDDLQPLMEAIPRFISRDTVERDEDAGFFDVETSTNVWRRLDEEDPEWPPPPPDIEAGDDALEATRSYAGYVNSLYEAAQHPAELARAERNQLGLRMQQVVEGMDRALSYTQNAVNHALKSGELRQMRDLTAARNVMYEKLVQLRAIDTTKITGSTRDLHVVHIAQSATEPGTAREAGVASDEQREEEPWSAGREALPKLHDDPHVAESELTRAARAKEAERRRPPEGVPQLAPTRPPRRPRRATRSARRVEGKTGRGWLVVVGVLVAAAIALAVALGPRAQDSSASMQPQNRPPVMQEVVLQQTPGGIILKAKASDPEGEAVSYLVRWRINGSEIGSRKLAGTQLPASQYNPGDSVEAEVTPSDGYSTGVAMRSQPLEIVTAGRR